jgi:hypothetical protein
MRTRTILITTVLLVAGALLGWPPDVRAQATAPAPGATADSHGWIATETVKTRFGDFEFKGGYPTADSTDKLYDLRTFYRAAESYLHFVTIMSMFYMQKGLTDVGLDAANKFVIFERMDSQSLYLTPNTESVYGMPRRIPRNAGTSFGRIPGSASRSALSSPPMEQV